MSTYSYVALDPRGHETKGKIDGADQNEVLQRVREMGFFPTRIFESKPSRPAVLRSHPNTGRHRHLLQARLPGLGSGISPRALTVLTRQLATLIEAGLPLLRGLRLLHEQEENPAMRDVLNELAAAIESGDTFSEALARRPKVFNKLFINMIKAGEIGGVLEIVLKRLADFMEKAQKIKGKVVAAMFYPAAVMSVAVGILVVLMMFVVPRFKEIFAGLLEGRAMPAFTLAVLKISEIVRDHFMLVGGSVVALAIISQLLLRTSFGRRTCDGAKLKAPIFGPLIRKVAISQFSRTLGTLVGSGVPILQALSIVKETAGNVIVSDAVESVHRSVKEGETIAGPLKASRVFPAMVVGMVDVGEQTGALPEMLLRIADTYDDEVDNAVSAMTSLLEPIMIVFLAVVVGCIAVALFLPLIDAVNQMGHSGNSD